MDKGVDTIKLVCSSINKTLSQEQGIVEKSALLLHNRNPPYVYFKIFAVVLIITKFLLLYISSNVGTAFSK